MDIKEKLKLVLIDELNLEDVTPEDIGDEDELMDRLWQVCSKTAERAKAKDMAGRVVTLKLKTRGFQTITRRRKLAEPVQLADRIFRTCQPLLRAAVDGDMKGRKFRLIGAGISELCPPIGDAGDLLDPQAQKRGQAERASDLARAKFGADAIITGRTLRRKTKPKK